MLETLKSGALLFDTQVKCEKTNLTLDVWCISCGNKNIIEKKLFEDFDGFIKGKNYSIPDCIIFIAPDDSIKKYFEEHKEHILQRVSDYKIYFYFFEWQKLVEWIHDNPTDDSFPIMECLKQGLRHLAATNKVISHAPPGHVFELLSKRPSKIHIQASVLASDQPQLEFVANYLYVKIGKHLKKVEEIFIDTMGIYQFVREAIHISGRQAKITNFHSYEGVEDTDFSNKNSYCILSCSSSGGLIDKVVGKKIPHEKVIVLIENKPQNNATHDRLLLLSEIDSQYDQIPTDDETIIEIASEYFSAKIKPPRGVVLSKKHRPEQLTELLKQLGSNAVDEFNKLPKSSPKLLYFNVEKLYENQDFKEWLKDELSWNVSFRTDCIVFSNDPPSEKIAKLAKEQIKAHHKNIRLIKHNRGFGKSKDKEIIKKSSGILVITAVAGDGSNLREIARDLREFLEFDNVPRHYLVAIGIPQTKVAWDQLGRFLKTNSKKRNYSFSFWINLPIGYDSTAWKALNKLVDEPGQNLSTSRPPSIGGVADGIATLSYKQAQEIILSNHHGFLPSSGNQELLLTNGFIFFENVFSDIKPKQIKPGVVYVAIATALQRAREFRGNRADQLEPTGYESVVLHPECFLRFNDSILQASLLRACSPPELDYSTSDSHSKLMKEFLIKIFNRYNHPYGNAAMEFAAALATKRLKLKDEDLKVLLDTSINHLKDNASALLGFLLYAKSLYMPKHSHAIP